MLIVDPSVLIKNLQTIARIVQDISIVLGISLIVAGVFRFKRYGEMRGMMSHNMTIADPLMLLIGGTGLLTLPWLAAMAVQAFFGTASPLSESGAGISGWDQMMSAVAVFVRLIGVGAFIRGWSILAKTGKEGGQPGGIGRGLIHIIAGILCIHIIGTVHLLQYIVGAA
ncbi:MAG: hypothetical protein A2298_04455 [Gammaproteobacteria bacterium RIFOXYB2_FULL_38_6]|nr:MAG: hypothetical protein A2298_04455 [Gammaproteobacteria bacterium RIFOXYB2_FULL_38_6]